MYSFVVEISLDSISYKSSFIRNTENIPGIMTTAASSISRKVLSNEALEILRSRGDTATLNAGTRAVLNTSYTPGLSLDSRETVLIPDELDSIQTLRYLELNETAAATVWGQFLHRRERSPNRANVLSSAKTYIDITGDNPMW